MKAMRLEKLASLQENEAPLRLADLPEPAPAEGEILIRVTACGVCRTDLDEIEGRTMPRLPVVLGHQVVGRVAALGRNTSVFAIGDRVGVAWIHSADGVCAFCRSGRENLCPNFRATGRDVNGGYAEYMTVGEDFAYRLPDGLTDVEAAPLLCAGAVGYRALRLTELQGGERLGLTGFGASGHLVLQAARHCFPHSEIFVFARRPEEREHALELGAVWAGDVTDEPPAKLRAIIDTTPAWKPVVEALKHLQPGGKLVINAIRKEASDKDALSRLDYASHLWLEKEVKSVANVTRADVREFLSLATQIGIKPDVQVFPLEEANRALIELKTGKIRGAKVLQIA
ncbi:MAG: alcohol dehydrogenase [Candidatus Roseilinea sp.]|nr:MAG: alcohol dehydrogenase [Candidatus Roseilinea sp.]